MHTLYAENNSNGSCIYGKGRILIFVSGIGDSIIRIYIYTYIFNAVRFLFQAFALNNIHCSASW
jgi:hypothetical protein